MSTSGRFRQSTATAVLDLFWGDPGGCHPGGCHPGGCHPGGCHPGAFILLAVVALLFAGCQDSQVEPPQPPEVTAALPDQETVRDYAEFTGILEAFRRVDVRARVEGFIQSVNFKDDQDDQEGGFVSEGDLLYVIDPAPFQAQVDLAQGKLAEAKARLEKAEDIFLRNTKLLQRKAIPEQEYQISKADRNIAKAEVQSAQASLKQATIDLDHTHIRAPFDGLVGYTQVFQGEFVQANPPTVLTTLVQIRPIRARFEVSEKVVLQILRQAVLRRAAEKRPGQTTTPSPDSQSGSLASGSLQSGSQPDSTPAKPQQQQAPGGAEQPAAEGEGAEQIVNNPGLEAFFKTIIEDDFSHRGIIDSMENTVDTSTGTAVLKATFPNKQGLRPGTFVRLRVPLDPLENAILVQERAIGTDLGGKFVLVVDAEGLAQRRYVELGPLVGQRRVILKGLNAEERYIIKGLQRARPGMPVRIVEAQQPGENTKAVLGVDRAQKTL